MTEHATHASVAAHPAIPIWTIVVPVVGLAAYVLLHGGTTPWVGGVVAAALVATVLAAVHHAEVVAVRVGEPFGAVILALAVTVIEVGLIVSVMLGDKPQPTLVRDTMHAVVMIVLHAIAGGCIVAGALRHREQEFRLQGAHAFLVVLIPMVALTLIIPNYTIGRAGPYYTTAQLAFVSLACLLLYASFTFIQTVRHRDYFIALPRDGNAEPEGHGIRPGARMAWISLGLMVVALRAVVLLAKSFTPFIQSGAQAIGAPEAVVGVVVAAIVLLPEALAAMSAALADRLQTSINLALGSGVASIGLTIPVVAAVSWWTGVPLELGVTPGGSALLTLSAVMALITYGTGRASLLSGAVHLILFAVWVFLLFSP
jgi:Ca2+:H+ antiporter